MNLTFDKCFHGKSGSKEFAALTEDQNDDDDKQKKTDRAAAYPDATGKDR